jgi:hypothetical protein
VGDVLRRGNRTRSRSATGAGGRELFSDGRIARHWGTHCLFRSKVIEARTILQGRGVTSAD